MTKFARIVDGWPIDICDQPAGIYHESLLPEFTEIPEYVTRAYRLVDGVWGIPIIEEPDNAVE